MQANTKDEFYMQRCLQLARLGRGSVHPNPMVGSVIVCNDQIIGEGYHREFGGPHAEVHAVHQVKDKSLLKQSTLYVNLEPCSHVGKTPACSDLIIRMQIPHVVIGMEDPFDQVKGKGIQKLRDAGVTVQVNVLKELCTQLNHVFIHFHTKKRPWIRVKFAQSNNSMIDVKEGNTFKPVAITNRQINTLNHRERTYADAIAVGYQTALRDDPSLTPRHWHGRTPLRIVFDKLNTLPKTLKIFTDGYPTWVITEKDTHSEKHVRFIQTPWKDRINYLLDELYQAGKAFLLVEGGASLIHTFMTTNSVNEYWAFTNHKLFLPQGTKAPELPHEPMDTILFNDQELKRYPAE